MPSIIIKDFATLDRKTVSISSKRQFTIPQKFYNAIGFLDQAECILRGNELIIRPIKNIAGGEFAEQILADLIKQGFSGGELLEKFKEAQKKVRPAVEAMLNDAENVASGNGNFSTYEDVFAAEE